MTIILKIEGLKELNHALKQLPRRAANRALKSSIRAGGRVVVKAARRNLPPNYVVLKKSLFVKVLRQGKYSINALVGPRTGKDARYDGWYAHIVEFGAAPHEITIATRNVLASQGQVFGTKVKHPGVAARPFFRPAFDGNIHQIIEAQRMKLWQAIEREANKLK